MEGRNPFDPINHVHNQYVLPLALAQRIAYLGPPTLTLIQQSPIFLTYLGKYGKYLDSGSCAHRSFSQRPVRKNELNHTSYLS